MGPDSRSQQVSSVNGLGNQYNANRHNQQNNQQHNQQNNQQHNQQNDQRNNNPSFFADDSFPTPSFSNVLTSLPDEGGSGFSTFGGGGKGFSKFGPLKGLPRSRGDRAGSF